jgi:uncharacterized repeat protein (TIGR01451 family)
VVAIAFSMHWNNKRSLACAAALVVFLMPFPLRSFAAQFTSKDYPVGLQPHLVLVYDFNGDNKADIAVLNLGGTSSTTGEGSVSILLGNGNGTFQAAKNFDVGGVNPTTFAVADFNGDGKLDVAVGGLQAPVQPSCQASMVNVLFGNGDGTFQPPQQAVTANLLSNYITAGDVNGDGKADLILYEYFGNQCQTDGISVFLGNGDGSFQSEQQIPSSPFDINGDGITDRVIIGSTLQIFLGQGNGAYKPLVTGPEANVGFFLVGDLNNDQKQDQVFYDFVCQGPLCPVGGASFVGTALGNGDGTFQPAKIFPPGGYPYSYPGGIVRDIAVADFNGDGKLDAVVTGPKGSIIDVLLGKGDGTLPSLLSFDPGSGEDSFLVADLNGDRKPDIVTANLNDQTISVVLNTFSTSGADLAVKASASSSLLSVTQNLVYTTSLSNYGPQDATNVVLTDTLPSTVNFVSATSDQGTCTEAKLVVTCDMSTLVSGDSLVATITVVPGATGAITNTADATASENDANTGNNTASVSTQVDPMWTLMVNFTGNGTGTVTMVSAQGSPLPYSGGVVTCTSTCSLTLPTGTQVQFTPSPDANMGFGGWTGACSGSLESQCNVSMTSDQTAIVEFDTLPNFVFGLNIINIVVQQGGTDTETVYLYPQGQSFTSTIALACTVQGASPAPTCSLSPNSVTLPDPNGATSTLTIATVASRAALGSPVSRPVFYAFAFPLLGILLAGAGFRPRQTGNKRLQATFVGALLVAAFSTQIACGGGINGSSKGSGGTPRGNYTVTITGASGAIQHSASVPLTVQ